MKTYMGRRLRIPNSDATTIEVWKFDTASKDLENVSLSTDRRFNRMRPSIAPRKRHQAG